MPPSISNCRLDPVIDVPNIVIMTTTPGRNHCRVLPPARPAPATPDSSGANRARKTSGCSSEKTNENGSRTIVIVSRVHTAAMSDSRLPGRAVGGAAVVTAVIGHRLLRAGCDR
jgi:hypothetical protein